MNTFNLTISGPDGNKFKGEAVKLTLRGIEGDLAILAGHIPFITTVKPCECKVELPDETIKSFPTEGGIVTVSNESTTLLLKT